MGAKVEGIGLNPLLGSGACGIEISDLKKIVTIDAKAFALAGVFAQLIGLGFVFRVAGSEAKIQIGDRKVGIEFDGALVKRNGSGVVASDMQFSALRVGFESFERGRAGFFEGSGIVLNGVKRFADFFANVGSGFIEGLEDVFFSSCLYLSLCEQVSAMTIGGF